MTSHPDHQPANIHYTKNTKLKIIITITIIIAIIRLTEKLTSGTRVDVVVQQLDHEDEEGALQQACSQVATIAIFIISMYPSSSSSPSHITTITISFIVKIITLTTTDFESKSFHKLEQRDFTGVLDLTWGGWRKMQNLSE